jgi:large subunit ribosomal protein L21
MYAIVEISGKQIKVRENRKLYVNQLPEEEGQTLELDRVLLVDDENGNVEVGQPTVANTTVKAQVVQHLKDDKLHVYKKKPRRGYKKNIGHRQRLTQLHIENIQR